MIEQPPEEPTIIVETVDEDDLKLVANYKSKYAKTGTKIAGDFFNKLSTLHPIIKPFEKESKFCGNR